MFGIVKTNKKWKIICCYHLKSCSMPGRHPIALYAVSLHEDGNLSNTDSVTYEYSIIEPLLNTFNIKRIEELAAKTFTPSLDEKKGGKAFARFLLDSGINPGVGSNPEVSDEQKMFALCEELVKKNSCKEEKKIMFIWKTFSTGKFTVGRGEKIGDPKTVDVIVDIEGKRAFEASGFDGTFKSGIFLIKGTWPEELARKL